MKRIGADTNAAPIEKTSTGIKKVGTDRGTNNSQPLVFKPVRKG